MAKRKTIKQQIVERLNKGFGYNLTVDDLWITRQARGWKKEQGAWSWYFINPVVGSMSSATECLKWKRWVIDEEGEIFEYFESHKDFYRDNRSTLTFEKID